MSSNFAATDALTHRIGVRLGVLNFVVVSVIIAALMGGIAWGVLKAMRDNVNNTLENSITSMYTMVAATDKSAREDLKDAINAYVALVRREGQLYLDTDSEPGRNIIRIAGVEVNNDHPGYKNYLIANPDKSVVLYVRQADGSLLRQASNFNDAAGQPLVGTKFKREENPELYDQIVSGQEGDGLAIIGGVKYLGSWRPVRNTSGAHIGTVLVGSTLAHVFDGIGQAMRELRVGQNGFYTAIQSQPGEHFGEVVVHRDTSLQGTKALYNLQDTKGQYPVREMLQMGQGIKRYELDSNGQKITRLAAVRTYEPWQWLVVTAVTEQELTASTISLLWTVGIFAVLAIVGLTALWVYIIGGQIVRPLNDAAKIMATIQSGDLTARAFVKRMDEVGRLLHAINQTTSAMAELITTVRSRAQAVALASAEIASGNQDLSSRTEAQASALQETASAMEQLGSTVAHNAENAKSADGLTQQVQTVVTEGGSAVREVVQTMQRIDESGKKIGEIIGVIDGIAFQTNILALNAAVEAARAGEHGRGFAVVAGEVRSLAQRSAEAAKEIKGLISANVEEITQGNVRAARAGETMEQAISEIQKVTTLISDISHASVEQSNGVAQAAEAVNQMDQTTQQNAAMVEQIAAAASSLRQQSDDLLQAVNVFRVAGAPSGAGHYTPPAPAASRPAAPAAAKSALPSSAAKPAAAKPATTSTAASAASSAKPEAPPATKTPSLPAPAKAAAPRKGASAGSEDDWESF